MVIVVDPRVFLFPEKDSDRFYLLRKCLELREDEFRVGMNDALWDEYGGYANDNPLIMELLQRLRLYRKQFTEQLKYSICEKTHAPLLAARGCDIEIEPTLLGAGLDESEPLVVYLAKNDIKPERVFPTCLVELQAAGLGSRLVSPRDVNKRILLSNEPRYPENRAQLVKLLDDHRIADKRTERQNLEFKGPKEGLTTRMRKDIAEAVCGMLRGGNGWVLVGVRSDGEIIGFKPKVVDDLGNPRKGYAEGYDDSHIAIRQEIERIQPSPRELFDTWPIDLNNGRIVVVIWVRQSDGDYAYEGKRLKRKGTETLKIIAVSPG
jgi:Schlafen, AlbA_2